MKILKIENGCGLYLKPLLNEWETIDKIDRSGLMTLLDTLIEKEVEMDVMDDENLSNQAHRIIYKSISEKLSMLLVNKSKFKDESQRLYFEEIQKYSAADGET